MKTGKTIYLTAMLANFSILYLSGCANTVEAGPRKPARYPAGEYRAVWVTRFEWPKQDSDAARTFIRNAMHRLAENGFNAVFFQVRGQCDKLYPSRLETWSPILGEKDPGWDPLAFALKEARAVGLEFHAYVNTHVCWYSQTRTPPTNPDHLFYRYANASGNRDWLVHDENGRPVQYASDNYVWLAPGVPGVQAHVRKVVEDLVRRYDVDGVHFDRIRMPASVYSRDPISMRRFRGEGNPGNLDFDEWTRDQFQRMLNDIAGAVYTIRPGVILSAAPGGLVEQSRYPDYPSGFKYAVKDYHQDAQSWLRAGVLDFVTPMIYWADGGSKPHFSEVLPDWIANRHGRYIVAGVNAPLGTQEMVRQVRITREKGGQGVSFFSWSSIETMLPELKRQVFSTPAPLPMLPWKTAPRSGVVVGRILDQTGKPVTDAWLNLPGRTGTGLSGEDGFFSFLDVQPGEHSLRVRKAGFRPVTSARFTVRPGRASRIEIRLTPETGGVER